MNYIIVTVIIASMVTGINIKIMNVMVVIENIKTGNYLQTPQLKSQNRLLKR